MGRVDTFYGTVYLSYKGNRKSAVTLIENVSYYSIAVQRETTMEEFENAAVLFSLVQLLKVILYVIVGGL